MPGSTFGRVDFNAPTHSGSFPTLYGDISVLARIAAVLAPDQTIPPSLSVTGDTGSLLIDGELMEIAAQASDGLLPPAEFPRIDRIVINSTSGNIAVVSGNEAANPEPPAISEGSASGHGTDDHLLPFSPEPRSPATGLYAQLMAPYFMRTRTASREGGNPNWRAYSRLN